MANWRALERRRAIVDTASGRRSGAAAPTTGPPAFFAIPPARDDVVREPVPETVLLLSTRRRVAAALVGDDGRGRGRRCSGSSVRVGSGRGSVQQRAEVADHALFLPPLMRVDPSRPAKLVLFSSFSIVIVVRSSSTTHVTEIESAQRAQSTDVEQERVDTFRVEPVPFVARQDPQLVAFFKLGQADWARFGIRFHRRGGDNGVDGGSRLRRRRMVAAHFRGRPSCG